MHRGDIENRRPVLAKFGVAENLLLPVPGSNTARERLRPDRDELVSCLPSVAWVSCSPWEETSATSLDICV